ncbi:MAG TPA: tRNA uridine-5-carboxymethylaminomethyl(34) synthesis GTPase MnmE [Bacteroidota bacterium]
MRTAGDTIAAIATPLGEGGISVIRISGDLATTIAGEVFRGKTDLKSATSHTAHFGRVVDSGGNTIDEVVATVFLEPNSYTGENTVEISCHGGVHVTKRILELILGSGARHAEPGEFTKRSFLNGKIDLSQAEAVADLIRARSDMAHRASVRQLEGTLSERIRGLRSGLIDSVGLLELELDFVEENLEFVNKQRFQRRIEDTNSEIDRLLETFSAGRIYREGIKIVIAGPPNAGKSSLMNALLESNRAIVTDIPGTTRDTIEEGVNIGGVMIRLVDTAGLRETEDTIEREGITRTEKEALNSDIVVLVLDASKPMDGSERDKVEEFLANLNRRSAKTVIVLNKCDLPTKISRDSLGSLGRPEYRFGVVELSAKTGVGLKALQQAVLDAAFSGKTDGFAEEPTVTNIRHFEALRRTKESLDLALESLRNGQSSEFAAVDLRSALDSLGEITGEVTSEEILNNIFSKFCIGK